MMARSAAAYLFQGRNLVDGDDPIGVLPWKMMLGLNAKDTGEKDLVTFSPTRPSLQT